jgi:hypothetical protein
MMQAAAPKMGLVFEKAGGMIGSDSDVLEHKRAHQKAIRVGERIEGAADAEMNASYRCAKPGSTV